MTQVADYTANRKRAQRKHVRLVGGGVSST
jgi:hypothetical protein